ncbi:MAG: hypothetical protein AAGJ35_14925, partial [Myxococcota bacterium]
RGLHIQQRQNSIVVGGMMSQHLDFSQHQLKANSNISSQKLWIAVVSRNGTMQALNMLRPGASHGRLDMDQIALGPQGAIYVLGRTNHSMYQGDKYIQTAPRKSKFLVKLDSQARWQWGTTFGTPSATEGKSSMTLNVKGDIVVAAQNNQELFVRGKKISTPQSNLVFLHFKPQDGTLRKVSQLPINVSVLGDVWMKTDRQRHLWIRGLQTQTLHFDFRTYPLLHNDLEFTHFFFLRDIVPE